MIDNLKYYIVVNLRVEGFHKWTSAPLLVSFLQHRHRHQFWIRCMKRVTHSDRDVEIILFKREVTEWLHSRFGSPCEFGEMSCEQIAEQLIERFSLMGCEVTEDGENGGIVCRE